MKKVLFVVAVTVAFMSTLQVQASEGYCIAKQVDNISYGSEIHFEVNCGGAIQRTPSIIISFLLPIPFNWHKSSLAKLNKFMKAKGYQLITKIPSAQLSGVMFEKGFFIFAKGTEPTSSFCLVTKSNQKSVGLDKKSTVWDVDFEYDMKSYKPVKYSGLTQEEIDSLLLKQGFVASNIPGLFVRK